MYKETQTPLPWQSLTQSDDFGGGLELPDRSILIGGDGESICNILIN